MISDGNTPRRKEQAAATSEWYVLGGGELGERLSDHLRANGHEVEFVDEDAEPTHEGDPADARVLEELNVSPDSTVVVATREDATNLLAAQLSRVHLEPGRVVVLANSPDTMELLADAGHEPVCATTALSKALLEAL